MQDRRFRTLEEDQRRPMVLQTSAEAQRAREAKNKPKVTVKRTEVTRGIMRAVVYPGPGTLFIETDSGTRIALDREQTRDLQRVLNEQLGYDSETMITDADRPDLDLSETKKDEENNG